MYDDNAFFIPLPDVDCFRLLGSCSLGRVVYTDGAMPAITPVNFALDGRDVIFRTDPDSRLALATDDAVVAFEADDIDTVLHTGWSVVVTGVAAAVRDVGEQARAAQLRLEPWVPGDRDHYVRITPAAVAGRRLLRTGPLDGRHGTFGPESGAA